MVVDCTDPNICTYYIGIDMGDGKAVHQCTITDTATPATNHPFYAKSCAEVCPFLPFLSPQLFCFFVGVEADGAKGVDFLISWGWDYNGDFTVLNVVQVATSLEAFFGYSHPNAPLFYTPPQPIISYADVGPNAVQHV